MSHVARVARIVLLASMLVVAATGCGGGDAEKTPTITSESGLATLSVTAGSLPDGVALEDISLETAVTESDDPAMPMLAVQLLPDGLVLDEAAALTASIVNPSHWTSTGSEF